MKLLVLAVCSTIACIAESSLVGVIVDQQGGPVIAAKLSLRGEQSPLYLAKSSEQGTFRFGRMEPGTYTLTVDQAGFCKLEIPAVAVRENEQKTLPRITLKVAPEGENCP